MNTPLFTARGGKTEEGVLVVERLGLGTKKEKRKKASELLT